LALTLALGAFVVSVWSLSGTAGGAVSRAAQRLQDAQENQQALTQALADSNAKRTLLIEQVRLLAQLHHEQPWAHRLADLTAEAPLGILLTRVTADSASAGGAGIPGGRGPAAERKRSDTADGAVARQRTDSHDALVIRLSGIAVDHDELQRFIEMLQRSDAWGRVELGRAARQPFASGFAVAFEIQCAIGEGTTPVLTGGGP